MFLCKISVVEPGGCDSRCSVVPTEQGADPSQGWMPKGTLVKLSPFTAAEDLGMSGSLTEAGGKYKYVATSFPFTCPHLRFTREKLYFERSVLGL